MMTLSVAECYADAAHITQTNPVKKLRQDNALTFEGREQAIGSFFCLFRIVFSVLYLLGFLRGRQEVERNELRSFVYLGVEHR